MKTERKITDAEKKRTKRFQEKTEALRSEGYEEAEHTVDIVKANIYAVAIMLPFVAVIAIPYLMMHGIPRIGSFSDYLLYFALFLFFSMAEMAIHEGIHGLTWGLLSPDGFSTIEFGLIKEYMTPYCYCGTPLTRAQYIIGSMMPTLVLGFMQGLAAVLTGNFLIFILSVFLMIGGGGDFLIDWLLIRYKKKRDTLILMDHPTELGFVAFEK
jgi:hypothetical protein